MIKCGHEAMFLQLHCQIKVRYVTAPGIEAPVMSNSSRPRKPLTRTELSTTPTANESSNTKKTSQMMLWLAHRSSWCSRHYQR